VSADVLYAGDMTVVSVVADNISVYCVFQSLKRIATGKTNNQP